MPTSSVRSPVAICVCTYKRPAVLATLIERLVLVAGEADELADVGVVVVDDDPARSAEGVVRAASDAFARVAYAASAAGNISTARNLAVETASESADWLALIDDDCLPEPGWLRELLVVQRRFDADLVTGRCTEDLPLGAPIWLHDEPFLDPPSTDEDGAELEMGYLKNTLVSADFLRRTGIHFDVAFGAIGGEDAMFFYAAHAAGVHHRYAARALVSEQLPVSRATLGYQLRRRLWYGNTEAQTSIASGRTSRARVAASGIKLVILAPTRPVLRAVHGESWHVRYAASEVLRGLGRVLGAVGVKIRHR